MLSLPHFQVNYARQSKPFDSVLEGDEFSALSLTKDLLNYPGLALLRPLVLRRLLAQSDTPSAVQMESDFAIARKWQT